MIDNNDTEVHDLPRPPIVSTRKFLIDIRSDLLKSNDYRYAKIKGLIAPQNFGMDNNFFGGNVYTVAELKNKNYYLLVNRLHQTIGLCVKIDELEKLTKTELIEWARIHKIECKKEDTKEDIINKLTAL
jgi:hypothetical protein